MKILNIEESAFEMMMARFEALAEKLERVCSNANDKSLKEWLDNGEVCVLLNLKKRQLQNYRDSGRIAYTKIGNVIYYRREDVMNLLKKSA